jgi:hypothetical protein
MDLQECAHCGNADQSQFISESTGVNNFDGGNCWREGCICLRCGTVQRSDGGNCLPPVPGRKRDRDEGAAAEQQRAGQQQREFKGSYHRRAHFMERFSAACCREPTIPDGDQQLIREAYQRYCDSNYWLRLRRTKRYITKRDIQQSLRLVDRDLARRAQLVQQEVDDARRLAEEHPEWLDDDARVNMQRLQDEATAMLNGDLKRRFASRYLEKWKSVKAMLLDVELPRMEAEQLCRVGARLMAYSSLWDLFQPPAHKDDRSVWKFPERKHFPNINFMVCNIMDELTAEDACALIKEADSYDGIVYDALNKAEQRAYAEGDAETVKRAVTLAFAVARERWAVYKRDFPLPQPNTLRALQFYYTFLKAKADDMRAACTPRGDKNAHQLAVDDFFLKGPAHSKAALDAAVAKAMRNEQQQDEKQRTQLLAKLAERKQPPLNTPEQQQQQEPPHKQQRTLDVWMKR